MHWLEKSPMQFAYEDLRAGIAADWRHFYTSNLSVKTELLRKFTFNENFPYAAMEDNEVGISNPNPIWAEIKISSRCCSGSSSPNHVPAGVRADDPGGIFHSVAA